MSRENWESTRVICEKGFIIIAFVSFLLFGLGVFAQIYGFIPDYILRAHPDIIGYPLAGVVLVGIFAKCRIWPFR